MEIVILTKIYKERIRMKQKIFILLIMIVLLCGLSACGRENIQVSIDEEVFVAAIRYGRVGVIKECVEEGVDIHRFEKTRSWDNVRLDNPISFAIECGSLGTVCCLLELGATLEEIDVNGVNAGGFYTSLNLRGESYYFDILLKYNYDFNKKAKGDLTVLDLAFTKDTSGFDCVAWRNAEIMMEHGAAITSNTVAASLESNNGNANLPRLVKYLLENNQETGLDEIYESVILSKSEKVHELWKKQKVKLSNEEKDKLGALVAAYCDLETLKIILEDVECENGTMRWFMQAACRAGNLENVKYIVENYHPSEENMSTDIKSAMEQAESNGHYDVVDYLIEQGYEIPSASDYGASGWGSLAGIAVVTQDRERLEYLLLNGIGVPERFEGLLADALAIKDIDCYQYLLNYALENQVELDNVDVLIDIIYTDEQYEELMEYVLEELPNVTQEDLDESLIDAVQYGICDSVKVLLEAGANPNAEGVPYAAVYKDDIEKIKLLVEYGMDVNTVHYGMGLLETSAMYSNEVMHYLYDQGAELTEESCNSSALIMAINAGRVRNAKDLIDMGIDLNIRNEDGRTAYDMAVLSGRQELIDVFDGLSGIE